MNLYILIALKFLQLSLNKQLCWSEKSDVGSSCFIFHISWIIMQKNVSQSTGNLELLKVIRKNHWHVKGIQMTENYLGRNCFCQLKSGQWEYFLCWLLEPSWKKNNFYVQTYWKMVQSGSSCALMIRPIQTKIGHDQTHPDHNQPWSDFSSFLEIVLVFTSF